MTDDPPASRAHPAPRADSTRRLEVERARLADGRHVARYTYDVDRTR